MAGTLSTPNAGSPRSTEEPKLATAVTTLNGLLDSSNKLDGAQLSATSVAAAALASNAVTTAKITDANVTAAKLAGSITDSKLSSPNNGVYKTLLHAGDAIGASTVAGSPYYFPADGATGNPVAVGGNTTGVPPLLFDYASGDYLVGSLTTRFRVKMEVMVGSTSPSTTVVTAGLYPLTIAAGVYTLGTVVTGSTAASSGLATNTISRFNSGDFAASALLADPGVYVLGFAVTTLTVPAGIAMNVQLQTRNT